MSKQERVPVATPYNQCLQLKDPFTASPRSSETTRICCPMRSHDYCLDGKESPLQLSIKIPPVTE